MLNLLRCYLSGRHEYHVGCQPGAIFLHCLHCGHRSSGWAVDSRVAPLRGLTAVPVPVPVTAPVSRFVAGRVRAAAPAALSGRVLPFVRTAAR